MKKTPHPKRWACRPLCPASGVAGSLVVDAHQKSTIVPGDEIPISRRDASKQLSDARMYLPTYCLLAKSKVVLKKVPEAVCSPRPIGRLIDGALPVRRETPFVRRNAAMRLWQTSWIPALCWTSKGDADGYLTVASETPRLSIVVYTYSRWGLLASTVAIATPGSENSFVGRPTLWRLRSHALGVEFRAAVACLASIRPATTLFGFGAYAHRFFLFFYLY